MAYAPYDSNQKLIDNSKLEFKVSPTATEQKDLLWANAKDQKKANNPVKFTFNHALAKIGYTVKTNVADDNVIITLNKITLAGSTTDPKVGAFYTKGFINLSKDLSKAGDATELWINREGKQCLTWSTGFPDVTSSPVSKPDYLFVIPQDFSTGTNELYVIVDYTISYKKGATETMTSTVSSNKIIKNFEQGKAYTINLTIGLTKIDFDVTDVNTWTTEGDGEIDIDSWN